MATKTISIDLEAYKRLRRHRRPTESFSDVIKRVVPRPVDLERLFRDLDQLGPISAESAAGIEDQVRSRRKPSGRVR